MVGLVFRSADPQRVDDDLGKVLSVLPTPGGTSCLSNENPFSVLVQTQASSGIALTPGDTVNY